MGQVLESFLAIHFRGPAPSPRLKLARARRERRIRGEDAEKACSRGTSTTTIITSLLQQLLVLVLL